MKYFDPMEFKLASPSCAVEDMNPDFLDKLDMAREYAQVPFIINSAFRSKEHELDRGRDGTSTHTIGRAVDLKCTNSITRAKMIKGLLMAGINRIIIYKTHIHADDDPDKISPMLKIDKNFFT